MIAAASRKEGRDVAILVVRKLRRVNFSSPGKKDGAALNIGGVLQLGHMKC